MAGYTPIRTGQTVAGTPNSSSRAKWMTPASMLRRSARTRQQTLTQIDFVKRHLPNDEVDLEFEDAENLSVDTGNDDSTATAAAATHDEANDNDDYDIRPPVARKRRRGGLRELPQDVVHSTASRADFSTPSTAKKRLLSVDVDDAQSVLGKGSGKKKRKTDSAAMRPSRASSPPAGIAAAAEYATPPPRTPQRRREVPPSEQSTVRPSRFAKARQTTAEHPASPSPLKEKSTNQLLMSANDPGRRRRRTFRKPATLEVKDSYAPDAEEATDFGPSQQFLPSSPLQQRSRTLYRSTTPKVTTPARRSARYSAAAEGCLEIPDSRGSRTVSPRQRHGSPVVLEYHGKLEIEDSEQEDSDVPDVAFDSLSGPETQASLSRPDNDREDEDTEQVAEGVGSPRQDLESSRAESSNETTDGAGNHSSVSTAVKEEPQDSYEPALRTGDRTQPTPQAFQSPLVPPAVSQGRRSTPVLGYSSDKQGPGSAYSTQSRSNDTQDASLKPVHEPEPQENRQSLVGSPPLKHEPSQQLQGETPTQIPDSRSTSVFDSPFRLGRFSTQDGINAVERHPHDYQVPASDDLPTNPASLLRHVSSPPRPPSPPPEPALVDDGNNVKDQLQLLDDLTTESQLLPESLMESFLPMPPPLFAPGALDDWEYNN